MDIYTDDSGEQMDTYIDDDGYVCFQDGEVFWTLHFNGWEAFLPNKIDPCYSTNSVTFPSIEDLGEVMQKYEDSLKEK